MNFFLFTDLFSINYLHIVCHCVLPIPDTKFVNDAGVGDGVRHAVQMPEPLRVFASYDPILSNLVQGFQLVKNFKKTTRKRPQEYS